MTGHHPTCSNIEEILARRAAFFTPNSAAQLLTVLIGALFAFVAVKLSSPDEASLRLSSREENNMEALCPRLCPKAVLQRPLNPLELSQISYHARAEITLLRQDPVICENCRSVYLSTKDETVLLGMIHSTGQWESENFPTR
jgi:hypothetical protein